MLKLPAKNRQNSEFCISTSLLSIAEVLFLILGRNEHRHSLSFQSG